MDPGAPDLGFRNIGLMVWSEDTLDYFAVRGNEEHARDMNSRIAASRESGRAIQDFVEYFLERGGGFYYSMARPETVEADSPGQVVELAAKRWELDIVVPAATTTRVDPMVVRELMAATKGGAVLDIRGSSVHAKDRAFVMGFGALADTVVMAYLPFPYDFSPFSRGRFYVSSIEPMEGGWLVRGKDAWKYELGELAIQVQRLSDRRMRSAIARFKKGLGDEERRLIAGRLERLTDPMLV
jgi:hypothetical protein